MIEALVITAIVIVLLRWARGKRVVPDKQQSMDGNQHTEDVGNLQI